MLLRKIIQHINEQNWFAVWLDFFIVVVGVFIGLQVSNWNDSIRVRSLEQSYIERTAEDLRTNIEIFESELKFAEQSRNHIEEFMRLLNSESATNSQLVEVTTMHFAKGTLFAVFRPTQTTFDELKSTGNLDIIDNREVREALVRLHNVYNDAQATFTTNVNWLMPLESEVSLVFDALRFDPRTAALFPPQDIETTVKYIRDNSDLLRRHAGLHYWLKDRSIGILKDTKYETQVVLDQLDASQNSK